MNTKLLAIYLETARYNNIDKAARQLGYTGAGLLREIDTLEKDLGVVLLDRHQEHFTLTEEGKLLVSYAVDILASEEALYENLFRRAVNEKGQHGILRIAAYPSVVAGWMTEDLLRFMAEYPNIRVDVRVGVSQMEQWMTNDLVDVAIVEKRLAAEYRWTYLTQDEMNLVVPVTSPLAKKKRIPLADIADQTVIFPTLSETNSVVMELNKNNIRCKSQMPFRTEDGSILLSLVSKGFGITFLSALYRERCPENVRMLPFHPPIYRELGIISNFGRGGNTVARLFSEWLMRRREMDRKEDESDIFS